MFRKLLALFRMPGSAAPRPAPAAGHTDTLPEAVLRAAEAIGPSSTGQGRTALRGSPPLQVWAVAFTLVSDASSHNLSETLQLGPIRDAFDDFLFVLVAFPIVSDLRGVGIEVSFDDLMPFSLLPTRILQQDMRARASSLGEARGRAMRLINAAAQDVRDERGELARVSLESLWAIVRAFIDTRDSKFQEALTRLYPLMLRSVFIPLLGEHLGSQEGGAPADGAA